MQIGHAAPQVHIPTHSAPAPAAHAAPPAKAAVAHAPAKAPAQKHAVMA